MDSQQFWVPDTPLSIQLVLRSVEEQSSLEWGYPPCRPNSALKPPPKTPPKPPFEPSLKPLKPGELQGPELCSICTYRPPPTSAANVSADEGIGCTAARVLPSLAATFGGASVAS
jgi:hypothetical protein